MNFSSLLTAIVFLSFASIAAPLYQDRVWIKSDIRTYNHLYEYAIESGEIWYRSLEPNSIWARIDFDAEPGVFPVALRADGANLMVLDSRREIHYKKVIKEKRRRDGSYHFRDIHQKSKWSANWFSFPVLNLPKRFLNPKRLMLPDGVTLWSIAHRGEFNSYFEDIKNKKHPEFSMVTTVYAVSPDGETVIYADPYVLRGLKRRGNRVPSPTLSDMAQLKIEAIDSSASTVVICGRHLGLWRSFYQSIDFDLKRRNPFLPGFYDPSCTVHQGWVEIPLPPLVAAGPSVPKITIHQTGMGNGARELRIESINEEGRCGYYFKALLDDQWSFRPTP